MRQDTSVSAACAPSIIASLFLLSHAMLAGLRDPPAASPDPEGLSTQLLCDL